MTVAHPPAKIPLDNGTVLRFFEESDAEAVARAVSESLEHLRPWMPWADAQSADAAFQRDRLRKLPQLAARGEEWQYGLFPDDGSNVLGSFGLMTRRGPGTMEIGYWIHVGAVGRGYATRAASALTEIASGLPHVQRVLIYCDEANLPSAAIPRRLGFVLERVRRRAPEAPGETGREMVWARDIGRTDHADRSPKGTK
jgi:RimJ/RimL family protein N-acetyltransferase